MNWGFASLRLCVFAGRARRKADATARETDATARRTLAAAASDRRARPSRAQACGWLAGSAADSVQISGALLERARGCCARWEGYGRSVCAGLRAVGVAIAEADDGSHIAHITPPLALSSQIPAERICQGDAAEQASRNRPDGAGRALGRCCTATCGGRGGREGRATWAGGQCRGLQIAHQQRHRGVALTRDAHGVGAGAEGGRGRGSSSSDSAGPGARCTWPLLLLLHQAPALGRMASLLCPPSGDEERTGSQRAAHGDTLRGGARRQSSVVCLAYAHLGGALGGELRCAAWWPGEGC
jgi:hypothetical protein